MSQLKKAVEQKHIGYSYSNIPRGTAAGIQAGNTSLINAWKNSEQLKHFDKFVEDLKSQYPHVATNVVQDDITQNELQGLTTFSNMVIPALSENHVGQMAVNVLSVTDNVTSIPIITFGNSSRVADGKGSDFSSAGGNKFVDLKLQQDMFVTQDTRSDTWLAQTNGAVASMIWGQLATIHGDAISKQIIDWLFEHVTTSSAWKDPSGNSFTSSDKPTKVTLTDHNLDLFTDVEKVAFNKHQHWTDCLMSPTFYASCKKDDDFKSDEYFQNLVNWSGDGMLRSINGMRMHVSNYVTGDQALCYNRDRYALWGIMSGYNAVAEPWRDVRESLDGIKYKTWLGFCQPDPTAAVLIKA